MQGRDAKIQSWWIFSIWLALLTYGSTTSFAAQPLSRAALVIGNAAYAGDQRLKNPCHDATAIAKLLRDQMKITDVVEVCDVTRPEFDRRVREFAAHLQKDGIGIFYFSGHGVESGGRNYLLPIGHHAETREDVEIEGYPVSRILQLMEDRQTALNVVLLDACRNNPLPSGTKSAGAKGLASPGDFSGGTIIGYATAAGQTADDGDADVSPYVLALRVHLADPGVPIQLVLNRVSIETAKITAARKVPQRPAVYSTAPPEIALVPEPGAAPLASAPPPSAAQPDAPPLAVESSSSTSLGRLVGPMVDFPGGNVIVGDLAGDGEISERPVHPVTLQPFRMGAKEVTVGLFSAFVSATHYRTTAEKPPSPGCLVFDRPGTNKPWNAHTDRNWRSPGYDQTDVYPAVCISYDDATALIQWLASATGRHFRLPSEAEWETAARADTSTRYPWGNDPSRTCQYANGADQTSLPNGQPLPFAALLTCHDGHARVAAVGLFQPNSLGLYDMIGNVAEWTADCWSEATFAPADGRPLATEESDCKVRIVRGGSWKDGPDRLRVSARDTNYLTSDANDVLGFRLAESP